ncbi:MAG: hypothetical protein HYU37_05265 [Acidobacteria bacterium]|nr:hypothetical protein [Acidobacteriota bacterium]
MEPRGLVVGGALAVAVLVPIPAPAQSWTPPRTSDGQIDLQGVWDFSTITPLERPAGLGDKPFLTAEEARAFEEAENRRQNRDLIDPATGGVNYPPGGVVPYNEFWYERGTTVIETRRTSLIIDPPDGRLPPFTSEAQKRIDAQDLAARETQLGRVRAESVADRPLQERCLVGLNEGPPMTPGAYNNHVQIFQTAGYVVLLTEMIHSARIVPLNGRPHLPGGLRQWRGDSRARWEGRTLVIETTNFRGETNVRGSSANMHLVERLTRVDVETLLYEFTVTDPTTWTRPWTAAVPMRRVSEPIYEYACHEDNYGLRGVLRGARAQDN